MCKNSLGPREARLSMARPRPQVAYARCPVVWGHELTMAIHYDTCYGRGLQLVTWEARKASKSEWEAFKDFQREEWARPRL